MEEMIVGIERFFLGLANGDKFSPQDKDEAKQIEESFQSSTPEEFFSDLYADMNNTFSGEDIDKEDIEEFLVSLGMITMMFINYKINQAKDEK